MIKNISVKKLTLLPLIAATYCMVAGGPYGLEDIVAKSGYLGAVLILLITPIIWSLPTALMVSELASALPEEGGFYAWVKRAMGPFWGFQEAWLTLIGSIFDMAIYPALFAIYLAKLFPALGAGYIPALLGITMILFCALWNICGANAVGKGSLVITFAVLTPFIIILIYGFSHYSGTSGKSFELGRADIFGGVLIAMWNYMGWDNASTIAGEVENPRRTYPLAMLFAVILVAATYVIPIAVLARSGIDPNFWETGGWVNIGKIIGGNALGAAIMLGGAIAALGTFNSLVLSLSRLPLVMAEDGFLPKMFTKCSRNTGAPWVAISFCSLIWAACMGIGFERLVMIDVLLTGFSIMLEFVALIALRINEPGLARPYRVPGGIFGAFALAIGPAALIIISVVRNYDEQIFGMNAVLFGTLLIIAGASLYFLRKKTKLKINLNSF